ncbi:MAG: hypothetical protein KJ041_10730 [Gammaproteobacteria bacterium]|nr:hypothetical protein [Gammaproteobacteria bacterium]
MSRRPQVLYIVHRVPYPPNRGDRIRSFHWLKFLAAHADVHLAFLADQPVADETLHIVTESRIPGWDASVGSLPPYR